MDLKPVSAAQGYTQSRAATSPAGQLTAGGGQGFAGALAMDFAGTLKAGEDAAKAAMIGGADPHSLVQALASSQLAVETAVTLRDKVVEAYQEVLRMPV
jgi:flagellar hook-basal body complex protein FliE